MKQTIVKGIVGAALVASLAACADTFEPGGGNGTGQISPAVGVNNAVVSSRQSRAEATDVTADMLSLKLTAADGTPAGSWDKPADFDINAKFNVGDYTLEAFYGDEDSEGFEAPYFYGSTSLKVVDSQTTRVNLTATLANAMVSIFYTPEFIDYMADYSAEIHSAGGAYTFYAKDETRPVYVKPGDVEISVSLTKPNGVKGSIKAATIQAEARHHYRVTFDVTNGSGDAVLKIIFDDELENEPVEIDLSNELFNAPAPELAAEGFSNGQTIAFVPGNAPSTPIKANIIARGGLAEVNLTVQSASLKAQGWPDEINLVTAPENMRQRLTSLGLQCRGIFNKPDQMAVIDFSGVLAHIQTVEGGNNVSTFTIKVVDRLGKTCEAPLSFKAEATPLEIALSNPGVLLMGATDFEIDLNYNGGDPSKTVTIQYKNERNTWSTATATFTAAGNGVYHATVSGLPDSADDLVLRAVAGKLSSPEITVARQAVELQAVVSDNDVFATRATASVKVIGSAEGINLASVLRKSQVKVSADGGNTYTAVNFTIDGETVKLTGLTPATAYKVMIEVPGAANDATPADMTTEAATGLENGNLDADVTIVSSKSNWQNIAFVGWGTNNTMTTSQGSGFLANYAYDAISGTIQTTDAHSGKAALIRSVGWGSGNTAVGDGGGSGTTKYRDAGLLHLGATRTTRPAGYGQNDHNGCGPVTTDDLDCGIAFGSRPDALSFWFKYSPKNLADTGLAEIIVLDASGNAIASKSISLGAASAYTKQTVALSYPAGSAKAAKIYVRFQSTADMSFLVKNDANFSGPGFGGNGGKGTFMGSQLYIDDIELIY
ncbi:MAG: DUF4493 domain-containing protein [Bacteroidales bacterium]|nr:DUF4493 domain-containing protein [Bacteroidales bacterium]